MRRRKIMALLIFLLGLQIISHVYYSAEEPYSREKNDHTFFSEGEFSSEKNLLKCDIRNSNSLTEICTSLGYVKDLNITRIRAHISPNHKLLYCRVNKCASTMTLELLKQLFDCDTECLIKVAEDVRSLENASKVMNDAFSFMVVREPYGRLFSTFCNIFYFPKEDWLYRGTKVIKLTRTNITQDSMKFGHDVTFAELIKYTVESFEKGKHLDEHVRPMHHKSCNPCVFQFDYIVHLENLHNDFNCIFNYLLEREVITEYQPDILSSLKKWTLFGPVKHLFRTIALVKHSNISVYNMFLRAWSYYQITGHVLKMIDLPFDQEEVNNIKQEVFIEKLKNAMEMSAIKSDVLYKQKSEAMIQAYSTIPTEYMERLSQILYPDCILFGYKNKPSHLFNITSHIVDINYFKGL